MIDTLIYKLKAFDVYNQLQFFFESSEIEDLVLDLQKAQLNEGLRSDNSEITPTYTPFTVFVKQRKGQPSDRVTLKDRGGFYNSIKTSPTDKFLEIFATDSKTNDLIDKYGELILGLTPQNIDILKVKFKDYLITKILNL